MLWATQRLDPYLIWLCCRSSKGKGKGRKGGGKRFQEGQRQREGLEKLRHFEAFGYHLMRPGLRLTADPRNDGPGTLRSRKTGIVHGDFTL